MASGYSKAEIFQFKADAKQFADWNASEADVDFDFTDHSKRCVAIAIERELTEKQRQYFIMYFIERKTMDCIANEFGVNKSTVSRTISAAKRRLHRVLAYSSPHFLNANQTERNKRIKR